MHDVEAKHHVITALTAHWRVVASASAFKSLNAQLAIDYSAYAMVICKHSHIKDVNNIFLAYSMIICQVINKLKLVLLFAA